MYLSDLKMYLSDLKMYLSDLKRYLLRWLRNDLSNEAAGEDG